MIEVFGGWAVLASVMVASVEASLNLPDHEDLASYRPPIISEMYASDGSIIARYADEHRIVVEPDEIPDHVKNAFISAEDKSFRDHGGLDIAGLARAMRNNISNAFSGRRFQGGSTITQQVAKNLLLSSEVTLDRKLRELFLALRIEDDFDKDKILALYLNHIYFGQRAYGIEQAAKKYFEKTVKELSIAEAAYLASLPKAPNTYHPVRHKQRAVARRNYVIDRMVEDGAITEDAGRAAKATPLVAPGLGIDDTPAADYFTEEVRRRLVKGFGRDRVYQDGFVVKTTVDPKLQALAETALRDGLVEYDRRHGWRGPVDTIAEARARQEKANKTEAPKQGSGSGLLGVLGKLSGLGGGGGNEDPDERREVQKSESTGGILRPGIKPKPPEPLGDGWKKILEAVEKPLGTDGWKLAAVIDVGQTEARIGFADGSEGVIGLKDLAWARPALSDQRVGAPVRRPGDVLNQGDVILVAAKDEAPEEGKPRAYTLEQVPEVQGAIIVVEPGTGKVRAMVGGFSFEASTFNRATQALRQPGSSFKPFVYLSALETGLGPDVMVSDMPIPIIFKDGQKPWTPSNYTNDSLGWAPMRTGLAKSRNLMTLHLALNVGIEKIRDRAVDFGVYDTMPLYYSYALGSGETTLMRMANAYGMFANGGDRIHPTLVEQVTDRDGRILEVDDLNVSTMRNSQTDAEATSEEDETDPKPRRQVVAEAGEAPQDAPLEPAADTSTPANSFAKALALYTQREAFKPDAPELSAAERRGEEEVPVVPADLRPVGEEVADPRYVYYLVDMMQDVIRRGTAARLNSLNRHLAGKTGTTNDYFDAWFIGFTPKLVAGVYVGFDDPKTLGRGEAGSRAALPIFKSFMEKALEGEENIAFARPEGWNTVRFAGRLNSIEEMDLSGFLADGSLDPTFFERSGRSVSTAISDPFGSGLY